MTISDAVEDFRAAAIAKGDFAKPAAKDHAFHKRMAKSFAFLSSQGTLGHLAFSAMLHDTSPHVRGWVSAQLLSEGDSQAVTVLEQLKSQQGIIGFTAEITLKEFHAGRLRSPFTNHDI